ncbi:MAG: alpha/beta hydrolase [Candidatus Pacearchaeota archaeon]|jgi:acetyl esterase/lipase
MKLKRVIIIIVIVVIGLFLIYLAYQPLVGFLYLTSVKNQVEIVKDIKYSDQSFLDIYLPRNYTSSESLPVLILVHGGAWNSGSKEDFIYPAIGFAKQGYATIAINYRLSNEAKFPAQIDDLKSSVNWIENNANRYNLDRNNIGLLGGSAGAHLALLFGTENQNKNIKAVVSISGPTNFLTILSQCENSIYCSKSKLFLAEIIKQLLGCNIEDCPEKAKQASPQYYVNQTNKLTSFLIIHGDRDEIVPIQQSIDFNNALNQNNISSELIILKNTGHNVDTAVDFDINKVVSFLDKNLKK